MKENATQQAIKLRIKTKARAIGAKHWA